MGAKAWETVGALEEGGNRWPRPRPGPHIQRPPHGPPRMLSSQCSDATMVAKLESWVIPGLPGSHPHASSWSPRPVKSPTPLSEVVASSSPAQLQAVSSPIRMTAMVSRPVPRLQPHPALPHPPGAWASFSKLTRALSACTTLHVLPTPGNDPERTWRCRETVTSARCSQSSIRTYVCHHLWSSPYTRLSSAPLL